MELRLDLHIHSARSHDGRMTVEEIAARARALGLDAVAVCDHDVVYTGPKEVGGVLIVPGVELSTEHGHLLGLFVDDPAVRHTVFPETVRAVRDAGGMAVLAHPFQHRRDADRLLPLLPDLDGMEVWNGRADRKIPEANALAAQFAAAHGLRPTAGSDAHLPEEIGNGVLTVAAEERSLAAIRAALWAGAGTASGTRGASLCVARSQYTKLKKTGSGPARYGKWALFALKCAWEDRRR